MLIFLVSLALTSSDKPNVTIEGGPDTTGHDYHWTVTNHGALPIQSIEIPQHNADLCLPPDGWTSERRSKRCVYTAPTSIEAIAPGRSAEFGMRISPKGARRGTGNVLIHFRDDSTTTVSGVEVAQVESLGDQFVPLIGMGVVLFVVVVTQTRNRRRRKQAKEDHEGTKSKRE